MALSPSKPAAKSRKPSSTSNNSAAHFAGLENRVEHLETGQRELSEKFDLMARTIFSKIDGLSSSLVGLQAQQPAKWGDVFAIVRDVAGIAVIAAGCIIYISGNIYASTAKDKSHALEIELTRVSSRLSALEDLTRTKVSFGATAALGPNVKPQSFYPINPE